MKQNNLFNHSKQMNMKQRYLTKSRFKEGLECLTKLNYTNKTDQYALVLYLSDGLS